MSILFHVFFSLSVAFAYWCIHSFCLLRIEFNNPKQILLITGDKIHMGPSSAIECSTFSSIIGIDSTNSIAFFWNFRMEISCKKRFPLFCPLINQLQFLLFLSMWRLFFFLFTEILFSSAKFKNENVVLFFFLLKIIIIVDFGLAYKINPNHEHFYNAS